MLGANFGGDAKKILAALQRSLAIAEYDSTGKILSANENFCRMLGFAPKELIGKSQTAIVDAARANSAGYREFWAKLGRGEAETGEYKRAAKGGADVWLQSSYVPVLGGGGKILKVIEIASDITAAKGLAHENAGRLDAASRAHSIVEYSPEGKILEVNERFSKSSGYSREQALRMSHRELVDPTYADSEEYREFWRSLNRGERIVRLVKRKGADNKDVWIEASYNSIFDADGRVLRIINYLNDVTDRVGPVEQIAAGLSRLAQGDLTQRIETQFTPALDKIRLDFNASLEALERSMATIDARANAIRTGSGEICTAADDLHRRTEQQASSLEETAAALEQVTTTVKKTAEGAKHARDVVAAAKVDADKSGDVVRQATAAMTGIDKSSKQISQIIGVIDEIAFQTNLLALNAGVEAARAGDAGRGFAVVASEVRALAQRSAEAAKEIKGLISASTTQVDQGVLLVTQTGEALARIVAKVVEINSIVTDIASSAQEQATGLQQINIAVNQMDNVTQKNAAMVEEATAASHALVAESGELSQLIQRYKVGGGAEDAIRKELKKAAPHAFAERPAKRAEPAPMRRNEPVTPKPAPRPAKSVAAVATATAEDWQEF